MSDRVFSILFAITFAGACAEMAFLMNAMMVAPTVSDASTFHIVPLDDHGTTHYITPLQNTLFFYVLFPVVLIIVLIGLRNFLSDKIRMLFTGEKTS